MEKNKLVTEMLSWTETPAGIIEQAKTILPNLHKFFYVSNGMLCHLEHASEHYRIGIVYRLEDISSGQKSWLIYYPVKDAFVRVANLASFVPVAEEMLLNSKRGNAKVEKMNGEFVVTFSRLILKKV